MSALHAEVVSAWDDPYVLVRGLTEDTTDEEIRTAAKHVLDYEWGGDLGLVTDDWIIGRCELWRWVPADPDSGYARWLWPAKHPGPGAFWAVEVRRP